LFRILRRAAQHKKNKFNRVKILLFESCCFCAAAQETILLSVKRKVSCCKNLLQKQKKGWKMPLSSPFTQRTMENAGNEFIFCMFTEKGHKTQYRFLPALYATPVCIVMDLDTWTTAMYSQIMKDTC